MLRNRRIDRYISVPPPSERLTSSEAAFYYLLGVAGLLMFLIGFFGLPMPLLVRWFGGA